MHAITSLIVLVCRRDHGNSRQTARLLIHRDQAGLLQFTQSAVSGSAVNPESHGKSVAHCDVAGGFIKPCLVPDCRRQSQSLAGQGRGCGPPVQRDRALEELPGVACSLTSAAVKRMLGQGRGNVILLIQCGQKVSPLRQSCCDVQPWEKPITASLIVSAAMSLRI